MRELIAAGQLLHALYLEQNHRHALTAFAGLQQLQRDNIEPAQVEKLLALHRIFKGPIATTLENERLPFLPVEAPVPGKNMYPQHASAEQLEASAKPGPAGDLLGERTLARAATRDNFAKDIGTLDRYPVLATDANHARKYGRTILLRTSGRVESRRDANACCRTDA